MQTMAGLSEIETANPPSSKVKERSTYPLLSSPPPNQISKADCQRQSVTPVCGPRTLELGSGKVAGKVLIVDHMG